MKNRLKMFLFVLLLSLLGSVGLTQSQQFPNFQPEDWDRDAAAIERLLEGSPPPELVLDSYRARLDKDRSDALTVITNVQGEITELDNQLKALGAPPEGEPEDEAVGERRANVTSELSRYRGILATARQADQRATELIKDIDATIRTKYSRQLLERLPVPVLPSSIAIAAQEYSLEFANVLSELATQLTSEKIYQNIKDDLLEIVGFLALGFFLFIYVRKKLVQWIYELSYQHESIWCKLLSLFLDTFSHIAAYYVGARMIIYALELSGLFGSYNNFIVGVLEVMVTVLAITFWLARFYFRVEGDEETRKWRSRESLLLMALGFLLAVELILPDFGDQFEISELSLSLINFAVLIITWPLMRALCVQSAVGVALSLDPEDSEPFAVKYIRRFARTISLLAPLIALAGYYALSRQLFIGTVETLALGLILMRVYFVIAQMTKMFSRWSKKKAKSIPDEYGFDQESNVPLWPVLVGAALFFVAIPMIALIWGARWTDISEAWVLINRGIPIGDSQVSLTDLFLMVLIFILGFQIVRIIQRVLAQTVMPRTRYDVGGQVAVTKLFGYVGYTIAVLIAVTSVGLDLSNLAIVLGALSVGIGFGLQNIVSNFISGIILLIERPVKKGDWIEISSGQTGFVKNVAVRSTQIETFDSATLIVPNADLISQTVLNWTHDSKKGRVKIPVHVAYSSDAREVERILKEIGTAQPEALRYPPPQVIFMGFGANSLNFELRIHLRYADTMMLVLSNVNHQIKERFAEEGIVIPITQHEVRMLDGESSLNSNLITQPE